MMEKMFYLDEAGKKLELAEKLLDMGSYDEVCYLSYRTAIYSIISLLDDSGESMVSQSVLHNLHRYDAPHEVLHSARILDAYTISHRYPACLPEVSGIYFDRKMAEEAIKSAKIIMGFVKERMG